MNREEFKMNLIRQFRDEPEKVMPLLLPKNRLNRGKDSIYMDVSNYHSEAYGLFIEFIREQADGNNIVQINFKDMSDEEKTYSRLAMNDLTNESVPSRVYYLETISFCNHKMKVKLELFYLIFEDGIFRKENSFVESELVFSFIDKKVEGRLTLSKMIEVIEKVSTLRLLNTYVDALYTKELETQFMDEVSKNTIGIEAHQELLEVLSEMNLPGQYHSAASQVLRKISELFPEKP